MVVVAVGRAAARRDRADRLLVARGHARHLRRLAPGVVGDELRDVDGLLARPRCSAGMIAPEKPPFSIAYSTRVTGRSQRRSKFGPLLNCLAVETFAADPWVAA